MIKLYHQFNNILSIFLLLTAIMLTLSARVPGLTTLKNEEVDQTRSGGSEAQFVEQGYKAPREGGGHSGLPPELLSLGVL